MNTEPAVNAVLDAVLRDVGVEEAAVYLREPDRPTLCLAGWRGRSAPDREIAWGKGLVGSVAELAMPMRSPEPGPFAVAVPIVLGDDAIGALAAGFRAGGRVTVADEDALLAHGRALARALAPPPLAALRAELARRVPPPGLAWLEGVLGAAERGERAAVASAFPGVGRRVGREPLGSRSALVPRARDPEIPLRAWRVDDAARVALLCAFAGDAEELARELYYAGDLRERCGALRGLAVVGGGGVAHDAILDAARASAAELFEAAVAENPYTSRVLPVDEFRKIVLKCPFVGVSIDRVIGLHARADAELSRMLLSYVSEREVAGRSVPPDIWLIVALHPTPGLVAKLCGYLEHPAESHRENAALALAVIDDARARPFVKDRRGRESAPRVQRALERVLAAGSGAGGRRGTAEAGPGPGPASPAGG